VHFSLLQQDILWFEMRPLTGTEKGGLALAAVLVIGGFCMIAHPMEMFVLHPPEYRSPGLTWAEHISKEKARGIGGGAILTGVLFASFVLYRPR